MGPLKTGTTKASLAKMQHLPEAIEALSVPGLPEMEAVKQDENFTCAFSLNRVCQKLDAFLHETPDAVYTDIFKAKCVQSKSLRRKPYSLSTCRTQVQQARLLMKHLNG